MEIYSESRSWFWIWHTISFRDVFQHHPSSHPLLNFVGKTNNWLSEKYILKTRPSAYNSMIFITVCCFQVMYDAGWVCAALINKLSPEDGPSHSIILHQIADLGNGGSFIILCWNHIYVMEWNGYQGLKCHKQFNWLFGLMCFRAYICIKLQISWPFIMRLGSRWVGTDILVEIFEPCMHSVIHSNYEIRC